MLHFCCWKCPFIAVVIVFAYEGWSWSAVVVCRMLLLLFYSGCWCSQCAAVVFFDCWCCLFVVDRVVWSTSQSLRVPLMTRKWWRPATDMALSWCTLMSGCFITEWGAEVGLSLPYAHWKLLQMYNVHCLHLIERTTEEVFQGEELFVVE